MGDYMGMILSMSIGASIAAIFVVFCIYYCWCKPVSRSPLYSAPIVTNTLPPRRIITTAQSPIVCYPVTTVMQPVPSYPPHMPVVQPSVHYPPAPYPRNTSSPERPPSYNSAMNNEFPQQPSYNPGAAR